MYPLSFAQRRLWFANQVDGRSPAYHLPVTIRLTGPLDRAALTAALADLVERHETLRTVFPLVDEEPCQRILAAHEARPGLHAGSCDEAGLADAVSRINRQGFDLACDPPLRAHLLRIGPEQHVLVLLLHHITTDGWSARPLFDDLATAYTARRAGEPPRWTPLPVRYVDYTLWQRELLGDPEDPDSLIAEQQAFWTETLAGLPEQLALPADRPRPAHPSHRADMVPVRVDAPVYRALTDLARACGATPFMAVQAALAALLTRLGAGEDVPVGTPVAGRTDVALDDLVGFFVNTLVLRIGTGGDPSFAELLGRVREAVLTAFENQDAPFQHLVEHLNPRRSPGRHPLFQVMLAFNTNDRAAVDLPGLDTVVEQWESGAMQFDLALTVEEDRRDGGLEGSLRYSTDLFDRDTVALLADRLDRLLRQVVAAPRQALSEIDLLAPDEHRMLAAASTGPVRAVPATTVHGLFERQAARTPDAVAVIDDSGRLSYRDLEERAGRIAAELAGRGVGRGSLVGVVLPRTADLIATLLGVLKTGAAYLPVDPAQPPQRIEGLLDGARPAVVLRSVPQHTAGPGTATVSRHFPRDVAHVIYTSGSTGTPKGVLATHTGLVDNVLTMAGRLGPGDRVLAISSVGFDMAVPEIFAPLAAGATVVLAPDDHLRDPAALARLIRGTGVTLVQATPTWWDAVLTEDPTVACGRTVWVGAEALYPHLARTLHRHAAEVTNLYGPTETTVWATAAAVTGDPPVIGTPLPNAQVHVLDSTLRPAPPGVVGELYLGGTGLALGYLDQPALTAARFVASPFEPGGRLYRTGDLARWNRHRQLEFHGRTDDQVKHRGYRIELGEIEATIRNHTGVHQAAVRIRDGRLTAYVTGTADVTGLYDHLLAHLPDHMVPTGIVPLEEFPLTVNGKIDRHALPDPHPQGDQNDVPHTATEHLLCRLFADLLDRRPVGVHDSFFDLGGHSILATKLAGRLRSAFDVEVGIRDLFQHPTVSGLAGHLDSVARGGTRAPLLPCDRPPAVPLSSAQQRLWLVDRIDGPGPQYNVPFVATLRGPVDRGALTSALGDVVGRHESLRTVFHLDGESPRQVVLPARDARPEIEVTGCAAADVPSRVREAIGHHFDLATDIPIRALLCRTGPEEHVLVLVLHHIATDGWSMRPLLRDLGTAYDARVSGRVPGWAPLPVQYVDYTLWQRGLVDALDATHLAYWRDALAGMPEEITLPTDRPRPAVGSHEGGTVAVRIDAALHRDLAELAAAQHVTVFMVLQAALATLLTRLGAGTDIPLGTSLAGRTDVALDDLVGFFVTTLVLRTSTAGDPTFVDLLARTRTTDLDAHTHQDVPFEQLVEHLNPTRSQARHPLFQVTLVLQIDDPATLELSGVDVAEQPYEWHTAKFDLNVVLGECHDAGNDPAGIRGVIEYATDLFDHATVTVLADRFVRLLHQVAAAPEQRLSEIELLTPGERRHITVTRNGPVVPVAAGTLHGLVAGHAARSPDAVAVVFEDVRLSYAELDRRADRLAGALSAHGVRRGDVVGVLVARTPELVVALLAALKAGAGYTLLDPDLPDARLVAVCARAAIRHAVGDTDRRTAVPGLEMIDVGSEAGPAVREDVGPEDTACVMFTSGSTGIPKGVLASHRALLNTYLDQDYADFGPHSVFLQCSPVSWDAFALELFGALLHGGTCVLHPGARPEPRSIMSLTARHGVTMLQLSAGLFNAVVDECPAALAGIGQVFTGGEPASVAHVAAALDAFPGITVSNGYGPVESLGFTTCHRVVGADLDRPSLPIGTPVAHKRAYVLDARLHPVPDGVTGELYVAGAGLATGYAGEPAATAERFVADPFDPGGRMYRTGDLARWTAGTLDFVGRADDQIKVRGFRIEPGEVEATLLRHAGVRQAVAINRNGLLVAYVTGDADGPGLRELVARHLPEHLVPSAIVPLDHIPLTANGKVDRAALPDPDRSAAVTSAEPVTPVEESLCVLFADVLGLDRIGRDDSFFDLGGHSLLAIRLTTRLRSALGIDIGVGDLFRTPTVAGVAALPTEPDAPVRKRRDLASVLAIRTTGEREPLFCIHPVSGVSWCYSRLLHHLPADRPVYGLQVPGADDAGLLPADHAELIGHYVDDITATQPHGPYHLAGWSQGGTIAHTVAERLRQRGDDVGLLALIDSHPATALPAVAPDTEQLLVLTEFANDLGYALDHLTEEPGEAARASADLAAVVSEKLDLPMPSLAALLVAACHCRRLVTGSPTVTYRGDLLLFAATAGGSDPGALEHRWRRLVGGTLVRHDVDCDHFRMMSEESLRIVGPVLARELA